MAHMYYDIMSGTGHWCLSSGQYVDSTDRGGISLGSMSADGPTASTQAGGDDSNGMDKGKRLEGRPYESKMAYRCWSGGFEMPFSKMDER
jgi:hypothetical protein